MNIYKLLLAGALLTVGLLSCNNDDAETVITIPEIETLAVSGSDNVTLGDSVFFNATVNDDKTPLSTLEVELLSKEVVLEHKTIRTKGNKVSLSDISIFVPFMPNVATGDELTLRFTLINVNGGEAKMEKKLKAVRPQLPETLYMVLSDESVIELHATEENPLMYESDEGGYVSAFSAKIATSPNPLEAEYVWNAGDKDNTAVIGNKFGPDVRFSYNSWLVKKIKFDAFSFTLDVEGLKLVVKVKGVQMIASGEYLYAGVNFTKGGEFEIEGIENPEAACNRDFFTYNAQTGKYTFTGESGKWDVYYSLNYNYIWVNRMADVAPATYWIIGAGLSSIPRWYPAFNDVGWDLDDVKQLAYMKPIEANKYQASIYLSDQVPWGFDIQIYSNRTWKANFAVFANDRLTGDIEGFLAAGRNMADLVMSDGFVPGYYRLTLDITDGLAKAKVHIERLIAEK